MAVEQIDLTVNPIGEICNSQTRPMGLPYVRTLGWFGGSMYAFLAVPWVVSGIDGVTKSHKPKTKLQRTCCCKATEGTLSVRYYECV